MITPNEKSLFSPDDIENSRIDKYKPKLEGVGGQQLVYSFPDYPEIVAKVEMATLLEEVAAIIEVGNIGKKANQVVLEQKKHQKELEHQDLVDFFGKNHVLVETFHILKIPVNQRIINSMATLLGWSETQRSFVAGYDKNSISSLLAFQEKFDVLKQPDKLSVTAGLAELRPVVTPLYEEIYNDLTVAALYDLESVNPIPVDKIIKIHPFLEKIMEKLAEDEQLKEMVKEFISKAINYSKKTGKLLDLIGIDNVVFFKEETGQWSFKLLDAIGSVTLIEIKDLLNKIAINQDIEIGKTEVAHLLNAINSVRVINLLANFLGLDEKLEIATEEIRTLLLPSVLMKIIRKFV